MQRRCNISPAANTGQVPDPQSTGALDNTGTSPDALCHEGVLRRLLKHVSLLLSSKGIGAAAGVAYLALAARALGTHDFGVLILIHSYTIVFRELASFKSWQAIIRYGTDYIRQHDRTRFQQLIKFTSLLDVGGGVLGTVLSIAVLPFIGNSLGFSDDILPLVALYCCSSLVVLKSTPLGILRLFDRYSVIAKYSLIVPALRLIGVAVVYIAGLSMVYYVLVWFFADIISGITLMWMGWRELAKREVGKDFNWRSEWSISTHKGIWGFTWNANLHSTVNLANSHIPTLLIGFILGPSAAGLAKIAQEVAGLLAKPANLLADTIYAELARLTLARDAGRITRLILRSSLIGIITGSCFVLVILFWGHEIIVGVLGPGYSGALELLLLLTIAAGIQLVFFPLDPMMYAVGKPGISFRIRLFTSFLQVVVIVLLLNKIGLAGAGYAMIASTALGSLLLLWCVRWQLKKMSS